MKAKKLRKGIAAILALTTSALFLAAPAGAQEAVQAGEQGISVQEVAQSMTLRQKVGQMLFPGISVWSETAEGEAADFTQMNDQVAESIAKNQYGGFMLYQNNLRDNEKALELVSSMQQAVLNSDSAYKIPLFIAADQEGGVVYRLMKGTTGIGNMALAASGSAENAKTMAKLYGEELAAIGINMDFAPVMDVNTNPSNPIIGSRSFSDVPETAAKFGTEFINGLHENNTIATVKHFPGHGDTDVDSHTGLPLVNRSLEDLEKTELVPFKAAIEAGADMVMTAHIQLPQIEKEVYTSTSTGEEVYLPATLSRTILTDLLREKMGFQGVITTDALDMDSIKENFADDDVYIKAINAGADLLLIPVKPASPEDLSRLDGIIDRIVALTEEGKISRENIDKSVERILTLKKNRGILDMADFSVTEEKKAALSNVGSTAHHNLEWELAKKAVTVVKNNNSLVPFALQEGQTVQIFYTAKSRVNTNVFTGQHLSANGVLPPNLKLQGLPVNTENMQECLAAAQSADYVIVVTSTFSLAELNPGTEDGLVSSYLDQIMDSAHRAGKGVVLVSSYLPYDVARYADKADAILIAYASTPMNELPADGATYSPNIPAALAAVMGEYVPEGTLPIAIPAMNSSYGFSDNTLFTRGTGLRLQPKAKTPESVFALRKVGAEYYVTTTTLNVRSNYSTDAPVLGELKQNDRIYVNGFVTKDGRDFGWAQVTYNNTAAYVYSEYLAPVSQGSVIEGQTVEIETTVMYARDGSYVSVSRRRNANEQYRDASGRVYTAIEGTAPLFYEATTDTYWTDKPEYWAEVEEAERQRTRTLYGRFGGEVVVHQGNAANEVLDINDLPYYRIAENIPVYFEPNVSREVWAENLEYWQNPYNVVDLYAEDGTVITVFWETDTLRHFDVEGHSYVRIEGMAPIYYDEYRGIYWTDVPAYWDEVRETQDETGEGELISDDIDYEEPVYPEEEAIEETGDDELLVSGAGI